MSTVSVSSVRSASPPLGWLRSPPAVLLAKDLRLGALVFVPCLAFLCVLALLSAAMPIFGFDFARSSGLILMWSQDLAGRVGYFAGIYWTVAFFAPLLSATAIVSGDGSSPARHLLPAMPVRPIVVYASKAGAVAMTVAIFVGIALAVDSMSGWRPEVEPGPFAAALSLGLIWAFAAPLFRRGFVGVFVVTFVIPSVLFGLCGVSARLIAESAVRETLVAMDLARWYADPAIPFERWALSKRPLNDAAIACAYAVVAALGLWCAWSARGVMLGRRSPGGLPPMRLMGFAGVALLAALATTVATGVRAWTTDERISAAIETGRAYDALLARPTAELVESFVQSRARIAPAAPLPDAGGKTVWDGVLRASQPISWEQSPAAGRFERALIAVLQARGDSDPAGLRDALRSVLVDAQGRTVGMQLAAARWLGPYTHMMTALAGLSRAADDDERAALILAICVNASQFGPEQPRSTSELLSSPDRPRPWGFVGWDLPPYRIRGFVGQQEHRFVEARISVVLLLASFERQLQNGTLTLDNPYRPDDRLEVDAATLRVAREAAERPLAGLGRRFGVVPQQRGDPSEYSDDETVYLPTSELFDRAKTDPAYLLPAD